MSEHDITSPQREDIGDGHWITLRDPKTITERQRRPVMRLMTKLESTGVYEALKGLSKEELEEAGTLERVARSVGMSEGDFDAAVELNDALAVAFIDTWSWEDVPITLDAVLDRPGPQYDRILQLVAPLFQHLKPNFEPTPAAGSPT